MAKKFALVTGLYNIFNTKNSIVNNVEVQSYNINSIIPNGLVDKNTIGFYYANGEDIGRYIGEHKITDKDRFIITQNDVFSLFGSPEIEPVTPEIVENTWRPILINGDYVTGTSYEDGNGNYVTPEEPFSINYINGNLTTIESSYDTVGKFLSIKYNIDEEELINFIKENIGELTPEVGNGKLSFEFDKSTVHTENDIEIENPKYNEEDPTSSPTIITHDVDINQNTLLIEGDFTANSVDDSVVRIKYKGTADRVDWFVENDSRDDKDTNNSTAKKFLYIECLQEYFQPSADYPFLEVKDTNLISQDSIVFITCGSIVTETLNGPQISYDADVFDNPEYVDGARFIWTQNMMFSANTWMPIFTRENETSELYGISPIMGKNPNGSKLIIQGAGGIKVITQPNDTNGRHERVITIDGTGIARGEGGSSLQDGKATNVTGIVGGVCVNVVAKEGETKPSDYYEKTKKNFIQIKEETNQDGKKESWIEVNGMDAKSIFIDEEIPIGGTIVGDNVIESGSFSDCEDKIPVGMSLHEVLYRILFKEKEEEGPGGDPTDIFNQTLKINNKNLNINAWYYDETKPNNKGNSISSGAQLPIGTKVIIEITYSATAEENVTLQFTPYGVETEPELIVGENVRAIETPTIRGAKAYKEVYSPEVECVLTTEINGFNEVEASEAPGKNTYIVEITQITQNGVNTISATNSITASQDSIFERHQIWRLSSFGNRWSDDPNFIATNLLNETDTISRSFTLNALLPYFIGVYKPQTEGSNYFDFESATDEEIKNEIIGNVKDNTAVVVERCGYMRYDETPTTNVIPFDANNWFGININNKKGPAQLVFVMPKSALNSSATLNNWITLFNALGIDITLQTGTQVKYLFKEISLYDSNDYYLYTTYNPYAGYGKGNGQLQYKINNLK
jgi:hypothetical protein